MIYEYAGSRCLPNLALAIYPTLQRHNIAPVLTIDTLIRIIRNPNSTFSPATNSALSVIPTELWLQVAHYLEPADRLSMIFAPFGPWFRVPVTRETQHRLTIWSRRYRKKG
ncbi:hypothetical protein PtrSN002B_007642 [Pyrenophora tritici-repentis]|nr:hypothetical protein PtrV1_07581 [Pyrenophora tritici-repentis]KAF7448634.1 hypothetical protein A1F99_079980 [Pyrenophora tritici-repentis]KAF7572357.1 hypothetical protein PtrM4_098570 [Pyrenophora tritici-repentis]KAG9384463.1 hypothetical protein A1F94_004010 [Pyrenophora tritici-repentis]KAI0582610.1 hypothetical protein Alg215_04022 [Pyrenophora tritici-repentis]